MFKRTNKKGFSLIELIVVVAIMAILVALLAPNVLKYIEKSKVGKDINSLDSVRLGVEAELMDEELSSLSTGTSGTGSSAKIKGVYLHTLDGATGTNKAFDDLHDKLFGDAMVLTDAFKTISADGCTAAFSSTTAKDEDAKIAIFLDGKGGVAVAAVDTSGNIVDYNGEEMVVFTKLSKDQLSTTIDSIVTGS